MFEKISIKHNEACKYTIDVFEIHMLYWTSLHAVVFSCLFVSLFNNVKSVMFPVWPHEESAEDGDAVLAYIFRVRS